MKQCMRAWEDMTTPQTRTPTSQFAPEKRKARDSLNDQPPKPSELWSTAVGPALLKPQPIKTLPPVGIPAPPNGYSPSPSASSPPTTVPRKRGRPSRADMEARTRDRASHHPTGYAPIAPVPGPAIPPAEKPKKRGRRSAADRVLQPANLPRRVHDAPVGSVPQGARPAAQINPLAADMRQLSSGSPTAAHDTSTLMSLLQQTSESPDAKVEADTGSPDEKDKAVIPETPT